MADYLTFGILVFTSFFTLINPLGVMPIFMTMTSNLTEKERAKTARKASIVAFLSLIAFAFSGQLLFKFFGISVDSLKVAGGIIFFFIGQDMLNARLGRMRIADEKVDEYVSDISVTPLAIPMICGPGAIANSIILMEDSNTIGLKTILITVIVVMGFITYFTLLASSRIINFLGETGNKVLMRIMGLIVMVIAVEFFFSGLTPILRKILMIS
jgi:multiple antibiotic resistance protein